MISRLGQRLKAYRELAGLSQNKLAERAGVPRPTITVVENGHQHDVTLDNACKLATALGISVDMLAGRDSHDTQPTAGGLVGASFP